MADVTLTSEPRSAAAARRLVRQLALDGPTSEVVSLLVTELVTNALRHADRPDRPAIDLRVEAADRLVRIDVTNDGHGFTWHPREAALSEPGGLGLVLVDKLADRWGIDGGPSTHVWLEVDRPSASTA